MKAFHNDLELKQKCLVNARYMPGKYFSISGWNTVLGMTLGDITDGKVREEFEYGDLLSNFETILGIPKNLMNLIDKLFELMPRNSDKSLPYEFFEAINVNSDLSLVVPQYLYWLLVGEEYGIIKYCKNKKVVSDVADLLQRKINGNVIELDQWSTVESAAHKYAHIVYETTNDISANYYRYTAVHTASLDYNTYCAAGYAAEDATKGCRIKSKYVLIQFQKLLELLREAK